MPSRRSLLAALVAGVVATGVALYAAFRVELWRYLDVADPVSLTVENYGTGPETVSVRIRAEDGRTVFEETYDIEASDGRPDVTRIIEEDVLTEAGRYEVEGELPDGTTDDYTLEPFGAPLLGTDMPTLVVSVEGEVGRLWVGGAGGRP
jgi:hypothetical protein